MSHFFFGTDSKEPQSVQDAIRKAFERPGSNAPATLGHVLAVVAKLIGFDRHCGKLHKAQSDALSNLDSRVGVLTSTVNGVEKRLQAFDPLHYVDRQPGTRSMRMELAPDKVITLSTMIEHGSTGVLKREANRVDALMERFDQLVYRVDALATVVRSLSDAAGVRLALGLADRGIFKAGEEYRRGEWTTHGGSLWICTAANTTTDRPGTSAAWRLAVKAGRDGRDVPVGQH
jgi:hypothetical protein